MAILDQYGTPIQGRLVEAAKRQLNRKYEPVTLGDWDDLLPETDWQTLVSLSNRLYSNFGIIKGAIDQKASYAVGKAWHPIFGGRDGEWGALAKAWLEDFYRICDVRGGVFNLQTDLYLYSLSIDITGDAFVLLTESETGYPQIQSIPSHKIGNRPNQTAITKGAYKGLKCKKGIVYNRKQRAVGYQVLGADAKGSQDVVISARDMIHVFDPSYTDQSRGIPIISHGITELRDIKESSRRELLAQVLLSSVSFIETNESGGNENPIASLYGDNSNTASAGTGVTSATYEEGMVRHFQANSGGKLETIKNDRPGVNWESFQTRCLRNVLAGVGWPLALVSEPEGQGTADRAELAKAEKAVEDRQSVLQPVALKIVSYALAKAIERGDLPFNADFAKWSFTLPKRISIDFGREMKARIDEYTAGFSTLEEVVGLNGKQFTDHIDRRIAEHVAILEKLKQVEDSTGFKINPSDIVGNISNPTTQPQ